MQLLGLSVKILNFVCCESVAEEEKMEVDHDQDQPTDKVTDEVPMETDNNVIEEQQQQQESSNAVNIFIKA